MSYGRPSENGPSPPFTPAQDFFELSIKTFLTAEQTRHRIRALLRPATDLNGQPPSVQSARDVEYAAYLMGSREASEVSLNSRGKVRFLHHCFAAIDVLLQKIPPCGN